MFGIDSLELLVVGLVALVVIGPKELPRVMRQVGQWMAKGRAMTRHVRAGFDTMMREAELEEMQKAWAAQNEAIMKASALPDFKAPDLGLPNYSADEWMSPAPAAEPAPEPPPESPVAETPAPEPKKRTRRVKPAAAAETPAPPKPKKPRRKAEAQPTEP
jgi:sec-independent protein translocase protein TatB